MLFKESILNNNNSIFQEAIDDIKIAFIKNRMPASEAMQPNEIQEEEISQQDNIQTNEILEESYEDEILETDLPNGEDKN